MDYESTISSKKMLPSISLTAKELPAIKGWKIGGKYTLEIEVEQVASAKNEYSTNKTVNATFRIKKVTNKTLSESDMAKRMGHG